MFHTLGTWGPKFDECFTLLHPWTSNLLNVPCFGPPHPVEVENFSKLCSTLRAASPLAPPPVEVERLVFIGAVVLPLPLWRWRTSARCARRSALRPPSSRGGVGPDALWPPHPVEVDECFTFLDPGTLNLMNVSHFWTLGP